MIRRVWLFSDYALPSDPERYLPGVAKLGVTDLVLALNRVDDERFRVGYDEDLYVAYAGALASIGVATHLMTWIRPDDAFVRAATERLPALCRACGARSLLLDAEGPWRHAPGANHGRAAANFFERLGDVPFEVGVTSFTTLTDSVRPLVERANYGLPQGYSVWSDGKESTQWTAYAPGNKQRLAHERWKNAAHRIVMGLAAFWQRRPDMDQTTAMRVAADASAALGVEEVAYWSHKWLAGARGDEERCAFVRELAADARDRVRRRPSLFQFFGVAEADRPTVEPPSVESDEQHIQDVRELRDADATRVTSGAALTFESASTPLADWLVASSFANAHGEAVRWRPEDLPAPLRGVAPDSLAFAALVAHLQADLGVTGDARGVLGPETVERLVARRQLGEAAAAVRPLFESGTPGADPYGEQVVAVATRALGVRETTPNGGPQIAAFIRAAGLDPDDAPAWCMCFAYWCHQTAATERGGETTCPRTAGVAKGWRRAGEAGLTRIEPRAVLRREMTLSPGDVMVRAREGRPQDALRMRNDRIVKGHAGIVERVDGGRVLTIEGNTTPHGGSEGDGVYRMSIELDDLLLVGFYRPALRD